MEGGDERGFGVCLDDLVFIGPGLRPWAETGMRVGTVVLILFLRLRAAVRH